MSKGLLIVIEGIDGAGKTTQAKLVYEELVKNNGVHLTKNPTDGNIGKFIRRVLSGEIKIPPSSIQYLFSADRQVHQEELIKELKDGEFVVFNSAIRNFLKVRMIDEATGNIIPSTNHLFTFIFGIRDKKANKILWYLMNLIHPADVPRPADSTSGFTFMGAMKNWEEDRLRETGERLMVIGDSFQPPSEVT